MKERNGYQGTFLLQCGTEVETGRIAYHEVQRNVVVEGGEHDHGRYDPAGVCDGSAGAESVGAEHFEFHDDDGQRIGYIVCGIFARNKTYGFVYNILLPFNNQQTGKISEIKSYYTEGTKEYYAARNTNPELYQSIEAKDQRGTWFTGETDYSFDAQEKGYTDYYTQGGSSYLFFEDSYVTSNEGIDRYAGKYPFNGTVDKNEDGTYKLTYNKLNIVEFIGEMESYIDYVTDSKTATGKYYSGTAENIAQWNAATAEESTFYKVTADYFPKENGEINQSANIYYVGSVGAVTTEASAPENVLVKDSASYKAISAVNELMFAYSTDTGCLNKYYGYSIASIDETTSYVKEFEYAAQKAVTEGGIGTYYVVATDYGWHILYVSFVYDGTKNDEADLGNVFSTGLYIASVRRKVHSLIITIRQRRAVSFPIILRAKQARSTRS